MSHLGKVKQESDKENASLRIVAQRLSELLNYDIKFFSMCNRTKFNIIIK